MEERPSLRSFALPRPCAALADRGGVQGFWARPQKNGDALNLLQWDVGIPGKEGVCPFLRYSAFSRAERRAGRRARDGR